MTNDEDNVIISIIIIIIIISFMQGTYIAETKYVSSPSATEDI